MSPRPRTSDVICLRRSSHQATTDGRASLWAARRCEAEADPKVRARLSFWHFHGECLPPRPRTCDELRLRRSSYESSTDGRASCGDCFLLSDEGCLSLQPRPCDAFCQEAGMRLRRMEQACVLLDGEKWRRTLPCVIVSGTRVKSAESALTTHLRCVVSAKTQP